MQPTAKVFYGIFLKSTSFCVASYAWERVEPVLRALAQIRARRVKGTLKFEEVKEGREGLGSMPEEITALIVAEVVLVVELKAAEDDFVRDILARFHDGCDCEYLPDIRGEQLTLSRLEMDYGCKEFFAECGWFSWIFAFCQSEVTMLLSHFGL